MVVRQTESRTRKSIRNAQVALFYYCINLILQFFSRKIFLDRLGAEILGLNTTAMNLLQFLNLAELGIGSAVSFTLYKPLVENDHLKINEIVSVQGYLYRKIGFFVLGSALILMCFFPWLFAKANLPLWYAYATFIVLLASSLAGYFFNYRQIVLTADQKDYKLNFVVQNIKALKIVTQIIAISLLVNGYVWWLLLEFIATVVTVIAINWIVRKEYAWLVSNPQQGRLLKNKYGIIITKIKQLFFHKIGSFALTQISPLIIYAFTSLTVVAIYGNYMLIVMGIMALLGAVFNSIGAGIGNLVAEGNRKHILRVFNELFSFRFLLVCTACYGVYMLAQPFITLWVGSSYLIDSLSLSLIVVILYFNTMRSVVDSYISAYGLFHDIWAPITEACLNIGLSILFGYFWGLPGILSGVLVGLFLIVFIWKPIFMFREGLKESLWIYVRMYIKHIAALGIVLPTVTYIIRHIDSTPASILDLLIYSLIVTGLFFVALGVVLYAISQGMRDAVSRFLKVGKI